MKNIRPYIFSLLIMLMVTFSSCQVIGDIFKAGMWTAVIIIVIIVLIVIWIFRKLGGRR
ncbi:hypothetical protein [Pontibacter qinzhouensis]|uniref:hypothetical protein n=1 Tax=Pontibacter qinzhouensis TaxID=2603253 RepID=UPI00165049FF|nr:hypothetical protein [Pontibacter qinzhouensis]